MIRECIDFSPVAQDYVWVAEYNDHSGVSEFNFETTEENNFYDIEKNKLLRFGLIGRRKKMYFECSGGTFNLLGKRINIAYKTDNKVYRLTDNGIVNNDIITYKKAYAETNVKNGQSDGVLISKILSYNFGYKSEIVVDNIKFNIKFIVELPHGKDGDYLLHIHIVTDKDLDGVLEISNSTEVIDRYEAKLIANYSGQLTWNINI